MTFAPLHSLNGQIDPINTLPWLHGFHGVLNAFDNHVKVISVDDGKDRFGRFTHLLGRHFVDLPNPFAGVWKTAPSIGILTELIDDPGDLLGQLLE